MNREEIIAYIKKFSPHHSKTNFSNHTDAELILLQLNIDFDRKRKSIAQREKTGKKKK
jgi:hypothetical protein